MGNSGSVMDPDIVNDKVADGVMDGVNQSHERQMHIGRPQSMSSTMTPPPQYVMPPPQLLQQSSPVIPQRVRIIPAPESVSEKEIKTLCPDYAHSLQPSKVNIEGFGSCLSFGTIDKSGSKLIALLDVSIRDVSDVPSTLVFKDKTVWIVDQSLVIPMPAIVSGIFLKDNMKVIEVLFITHTDGTRQLRKLRVYWDAFMRGDFNMPEDTNQILLSARKLFMDEHSDLLR